MNYLKNRAINLRKKGYSYGIIKERLGISKSTLSNWLSRIEFIPNKEVIKKIGHARLKSAIFRQKNKFESIKRAKKEAEINITSISKRDLFMLGIGLYLGEGEKSHENVRISNSDPRIIKLAIKWLTNICGVPKKNLKPFIHAYPDDNLKDVLNFWSKEINIPVSEFGKITIDKRKNKTIIKKHSLPYGTLHLHSKSNGMPDLGVYLHRKIMAWIDRSLELSN